MYQWRVSSFVEQRVFVAQAPVFAEMPAVIAVEDDNRVAPQVEPVECLQKYIDLRIDERHVRVVSTPKSPAALVAIDVVRPELVVVVVEGQRRHLLQMLTWLGSGSRNRVQRIRLSFAHGTPHRFDPPA